MNRAGAREPLPDALRALALVGVLLVNAAGYPDGPWGPLLGALRPEGSALASGLHGVIATFVQGKAYPLLAFLFGMGLALAWRKQRARGLAPSRAARRRLRRLLLLGLLHGLLLYYGDILTLYALCGLLVVQHVDERWSTLRARLKRAVLWALAVTAVGVVLSLLAAMAPDAAAAPEPRAADMPTLRAWAAANASAYLWMQLGALLFFLPVLRLCMLAGIAAARLRWLQHRRWRAAHRRLIARLALPALLANVLYGAAMALAVRGSPGGGRAWTVEVFSPLVGLPLAAVWLSLAVLHVAPRPTGLWTRLQSLGRNTLSVYIGHSVLCLLLFSGATLGWLPSTAVMTAWSLALWALMISAARRWPQPWWLERWLAR